MGRNDRVVAGGARPGPGVASGMTVSKVEMRALSGLPMVQPGDKISGLVLAALARDGVRLEDHNVVVVAQKIISKAEGRIVPLSAVRPGAALTSSAA